MLAQSEAGFLQITKALGCGKVNLAQVCTPAHGGAFAEIPFIFTAESCLACPVDLA
jgi:hypothetical protein